MVDAAASLFLEGGWAAVTHAEVARRSGYAKATIYAHWPTSLDLVGASVVQLCSTAEHASPTGDLRADLVRDLADFATDLADGHLARILGGVIERAGRDPRVDDIRQQLSDEGSRSIEALLRAHLPAGDVDASLALLTGAVLVRITIQGRPADQAFVADLVDRVLAAAQAGGGGAERDGA